MPPRKRCLEKSAGMDRAEVSRMLGYLGYTSSAKSKATPEKKAQAANALRIYRGLQGPEKAEYLRKWTANKHNKDLSWVVTFSDEEREDEATTKSIVDGYFNKNEILSFNKIGTSTMSEEHSANILVALIQESEGIFNFSSDTIANKIPELVTYQYKKHMGIVHTESSSSSTSWKQDASGDVKKMKKSLGDVTGDDPPLPIKLENPELAALQSALAKLKPFKPKLDKLLGEARDLAAHLQVQAKKDETLATKVEEITASIDTLQTSINEMRGEIVVAEAANGSESNLAELSAHVQLTMTKAEAHELGIKGVLKRMKGFII